MIAGAAVLGLAASYAMTAPKPAELSTAWELEFNFKNPMPIQVPTPGAAKASTYWYLLYTVRNRTENDQIFVPEIVLYTDTGEIIRSGKGVPSGVFDAIAKRYNNPLLKDQTSIGGTIRQGEDNAKEGVAIFTDLDSKCGSFDVFVGGLSGEISIVTPPNPVPVPVTAKDGARTVENRDKIVLSKTLDLKFLMPGEAAARFSTPVVFVSKDWVMR
jgi:hypothetical protein